MPGSNYLLVQINDCFQLMPGSNKCLMQIVSSLILQVTLDFSEIKV